MRSDPPPAAARRRPLGRTARTLLGATAIALLCTAAGCSSEQAGDGGAEGAGDPAAEPTTDRTADLPPPELIDADCPDPSTPAGPGDLITCQVLVLPEDRSRPDDRQVELPVLTFRPTTPAPTTTAPTTTAPTTAEVASSPVVYLHGGPGGGAVKRWATWSTDADALGTDVVVYDQRGGGAAVPRLECPEHDRAVFDALADDGDPADERASVAHALE
ncbi:MAG: alpha/beta hydrolase, partial [Actinomycetota bacterium]|nr:alpha/beta hydrolase [Actinomycetota bacterium]